MNNFEIVMLKMFSANTRETPEPERANKGEETAYEKIWDRFKQIEENDKALSMKPVNKQKMNADMFSSFPTKPKEPKTPEQFSQEAEANTWGINKPPKNTTTTTTTTTTPKQPSYKDMLTNPDLRTMKCKECGCDKNHKR